MMSPSDGPIAPPLLLEGFALHPLEAVGSTNDEARRLAEAGAPDRTVVWAREQTAGRGRRGRSWASPPGNLYCSVLLRPACPLRQAAQLSMVAGAALADALRRLGPPRDLAVTLKWPNDVLLGGAKAAGILLEAGGGGPGGGCAWLVVGTGVNVASCPPADLLPYPATCLAREGFERPTVEGLLAAYLAALDVWLARWLTQGFAPVRAAWLARAHGLGGAVTLRLVAGAGGELRGRFAGLSEDGALQLSQEDGGLRRITAGDVFFRGELAAS
jgi:BirA family transcriptional regulator, biotin operon repressor / biotin---[acetyl-CoA-carboxylase] ligase